MIGLEHYTDEQLMAELDARRVERARAAKEYSRSFVPTLYKPWPYAFQTQRDDGGWYIVGTSGLYERMQSWQSGVYPPLQSGTHL